jgi:hypothetical protein
MPINRLLIGSKLTPEEVERLNRAFTFTLRSLSLVDRGDPVCEIVAKKVIEIGGSGVLDPAEISKLTIERLGLRQ